MSIGFLVIPTKNCLILTFPAIKRDLEERKETKDLWNKATPDRRVGNRLLESLITGLIARGDVRFS